MEFVGFVLLLRIVEEDIFKRKFHVTYVVKEFSASTVELLFAKQVIFQEKVINCAHCENFRILRE